MDLGEDFVMSGLERRQWIDVGYKYDLPPNPARLNEKWVKQCHGAMIGCCATVWFLMPIACCIRATKCYNHRDTSGG